MSAYIELRVFCTKTLGGAVSVVGIDRDPSLSPAQALLALDGAKYFLTSPFFTPEETPCP